jgi:AcrR family transcriptional regulator
MLEPLRGKSTFIPMLSIEPKPERQRGRPKVRSDCEQRRLIVVEATELFMKSGYVAMKMDDIAGECGVSKRTLYRLFPSKLDLFRSMVETHRHTMLAFPPMDAALPLDEALMQIFRVDLESEANHRRMHFIELTIREARQIPELGEILHQEGGEKSRADLANWFRERREMGLAKIGDPFFAASVLMDMVFGAVALKPGPDVHWPGGEKRRAYMRDCIRCFVNGIR